MRRAGLALVATFAAAIVAAPAQALHCNGDILTVDAGAETLYVDDRTGMKDERPLYVYLESNDQPGLQSGADYVVPCDGIWCLLYVFVDDCAHSAPDTLLV